jgi:hypothetical protein
MEECLLHVVQTSTVGPVAHHRMNKNSVKWNKTQDKEKNLTPPQRTLLLIKIVIWAFLLYDAALVPALTGLAIASTMWLHSFIIC